MSGPQPFRGFPTRTAFCRAQRDAGATLSTIADALGCTPQSVHSMLKGADKAARTRAIRDGLERHAGRRGLTVAELSDRLLEAIVDGDLVDAVLDDGEAAE